MLNPTICCRQRCKLWGIEGYSVFNLTAGLTRGNWDLSLYARNLLDKNAITSWELYAIGPVILQPRTIGVNVDRKY
jgi:outer membrane receptor protein involved in Fe transport